jgi:hypothetical protein
VGLGPEYYGLKTEAKSIFLTDSKKEIDYLIRVRVKAVATSKDSLVTLWMRPHISTFNDDEVFGAALTALGTLEGKATLISTPKGMDKLYYKTDDQNR